jgi:nascent polypeptide-associated complex subunit beta
MDADAVKQKLQKMFGGSNVQTGGKGSVRRKHKAVRKHAAQDDKKLQSTLKKMQVNPIPGIEEVNLFKEDGSIIHFVNPKGAYFWFSQI